MRKQYQYCFRVGRHATTERQRAEGRRLAAALRQARQARNTPQASLALASGVPLDTIRALEGDRITAPSFFNVARLAAELELTLDRLAQDALQG
jgi:transcriptional regulator with XRE-family HTH domain